MLMQSCDSHILGAKMVAQVSGYPEMHSVMMLENSQKENYKGKSDRKPWVRYFESQKAL